MFQVKKTLKNILVNCLTVYYPILGFLIILPLIIMGLITLKIDFLFFCFALGILLRVVRYFLLKKIKIQD